MTRHAATARVARSAVTRDARDTRRMPSGAKKCGRIGRIFALSGRARNAAISGGWTMKSARAREERREDFGDRPRNDAKRVCAAQRCVSSAVGGQGRKRRNDGHHRVNSGD
nr:MAG TPA: hypothetical protein [Caudoviricetes sp.]